MAPQEQHRYEQANGEFRQVGFLRDVNRDENFGDAFFSDGLSPRRRKGKSLSIGSPKTMVSNHLSAFGFNDLVSFT
jgi:hypothetical protein